MTSNPSNYWGWGRDDFEFSQQELSEIADLLRQFLDFTDLSIQDPTPLDSLSLSDPRIHTTSGLDEIISTKKYDRVKHTYGKAYRDLVRGFRGDYSSAPDLVAYPNNEDDIRAVMDWALDKEINVIPFGGGTSVVGGVEPDLPDEREGPVISLDLKNLNNVKRIDPQSELAKIQAGATGPQLENQLQKKGYTLRHYPQSYEFSTLGGWIATRASGHYATNETRIDDLVNGARMLTPSGVMDHSDFPSTGAGPDPDGLICGSEGTLGVISEATMKIRQKPTYRSKASVCFEEFSDAVDATRELAQSRLNPANCRLLDAKEAFVNQVSSEGKNVLILGFESRVKPVKEELETTLELCRDHGGHCEDDPIYTAESNSNDDRAGEQWKESFLEGPYLFNALVRLGVIVDTFETACSWNRFEDFHRNVTSAVNDAIEEVSGNGIVTCRFTHLYPDGPAPYYTFLAQAKNGSELSQWRKIKQAASEAVQKNHGTITHHHAVGRVHEPYLEEERSSSFMRSLSAVKQELDPRNLMNPGALLGEPGENQ